MEYEEETPRSQERGVWVAPPNTSHNTNYPLYKKDLPTQGGLFQPRNPTIYNRRQNPRSALVSVGGGVLKVLTVSS